MRKSSRNVRAVAAVAALVILFEAAPPFCSPAAALFVHKRTPAQRFLRELRVEQRREERRELLDHRQDAVQDSEDNARASEPNSETEAAASQGAPEAVDWAFKLACLLGAIALAGCGFWMRARFSGALGGLFSQMTRASDPVQGRLLHRASQFQRIDREIDAPADMSKIDARIAEMTGRRAPAAADTPPAPNPVLATVATAETPPRPIYAPPAPTPVSPTAETPPRPIYAPPPPSPSPAPASAPPPAASRLPAGRPQFGRRVA